MLDSSPSVGSLKCDPMSVAEIDAHPDADLIWSTIVSLRNAARATFDAESDDAYPDTDEIAEDAAAEAEGDCRNNIKNWSDDIRSEFEGDEHGVEWLLNQIKDAADHV